MSMGFSMPVGPQRPLPGARPGPTDEEREQKRAERVLKKLDALYAKLPTINCKGLCWTSCGPIDMSIAERKRITDLGVTIPKFTEEAAARWANNEHVDLCPAFSMGAVDGAHPGCTVYEARPTVCRIWGVTESMQCEWGCEATGTLSNLQAFQLLAEADLIGGSEHGITADDAKVFERLLENPDAADLLARYIEGDVSVREEALDLIKLAQRGGQSHARRTP
jgi:hypothetical protein